MRINGRIRTPVKPAPVDVAVAATPPTFSPVTGRAGAVQATTPMEFCLCLSLILLLRDINGKGKKMCDYLTCFNIHQSIVTFVCFVSVRIF
jgi:hypothetical protein